MASMSPLAPEHLPALPPIAGVALASAHCGIRYKERRDLMVALLAPGTTVAGVFTKSKTRGAPVDWCRAGVKRGKARAIVVNSGNSNTFTGKVGVEVVRRTAAATAKLAKCAPRDVFIASTGVIGEPPPVDKIVNALPAMAKSVAGDSAAWQRRR